MSLSPRSYKRVSAGAGHRCFGVLAFVACEYYGWVLLGHDARRSACLAGLIGSRGAIVIILANGKTNEVSQRTDDTGALWVRLGDLPDATGWQMKPQGACLGELCVPLPMNKREEWIADADDWVWFNYSEFADMIGQKHVRDGDVWSLGSVPEVRRVGLESAIAPDFEVTERNGNPLRLSDLRGHKVVLFTWSSW